MYNCEFNNVFCNVNNYKYEESLDMSFTIEELNIALFNLKDNKAPGSDSIPTEYYKHAQFEFKEKLLNVFNKIYETR